MEKKRIAWLDYARSIAIICVCFCHSTEVFYYGILTGISETTCAMWILQNSLYTIGRLGVPIFLMLTGALMLNKEIKPNDFYRNYLFPLFITTEVWIIINNLFNCFISNVSFELKPLIKKMIFLDYPDLSHMWYMPMILGLYFAIPFLSIVVKNTKLNDFFWPAGLVFSFCFVLPTINIVIGKNYSTVLTLSFLGGTYGLYVLLGYYIYTAKLNMSKKTILFIFFISFISSSFIQYALYKHHIFSKSFLWYSSPFLLIMGSALFYLVKDTKINSEKINDISKKLSQKAFGIYLTHNIIIIIVQKYILTLSYFNNITITLKILILFVTSLTFGYFLVWIISIFGKKLPKLLFNIR